MKNITVSDLVEFLTNPDEDLLTEEEISVIQAIWTTAEKQVMRHTYVDKNTDVSYIRSREYSRILEKGKSKVKVVLDIDFDNPPKDLAISLLKKCPYFLLWPITFDFKETFSLSQSQECVEIVYERFLYIIENESEVRDTVKDMVENEIDFITKVLIELSVFLSHSLPVHLPTTSQLRFVICVVERFDKSHTNHLYILFSDMLESKHDYLTQPVSLLIESTLLNTLTVNNEFTSKDDKRDFNLTINMLIRNLVNYSKNSVTLEYLFDRLIEQKEDKETNKALCYILQNPHFNKLKAVKLLRQSR